MFNPRYSVCSLLYLFRCDGDYMLSIEIHTEGSEKKYIGYLTADNLDCDKVAYACQSSNGCVHIKTSYITFDAEFDDLAARNEFYLMISPNIGAKLATHYSIKGRKTCIGKVHASFILKYSYFDRMHNAIDTLSSQTLQRIIPSNHDKYLFSTSCKGSIEVHDNFELKGLQREAFKAIVSIESWKAPILIFGSFGTGKTRILASAIDHALHKSATFSRILLCAHNNSTVDNFVHNYFDSLMNGGRRVNIMRLIPKQDYTARINGDFYHYYGTTLDCDIQKLHLIVTTFTTASHLLKMKLQFTHIFIDEGAQAREPESIIPLCLANKNTKIVIVGDHKQV